MDTTTGQFPFLRKLQFDFSIFLFMSSRHWGERMEYVSESKAVDVTDLDESSPMVMIIYSGMLTMF